MSLKYDYFDGTSGLLQQLDAAFAAGEAFVGTGAVDVESLSLGDRNGSNLGAGSTIAGTYFDIDGASAGYRLWMYVAGEVAPASAGRNLVQVTLLSGDTSSQVAVKIAAALNGLAQMDFSAITVGGSIESTTTAAKLVNPLTLGGSGWGTAVAAQVSAGSNPTGNYAQISSDLKSNAQSGFTVFTLNYPATGISSAILRGTQGTTFGPNNRNRNCAPQTNNVGMFPANPSTLPNNLILKAYLAGISSAFASQNIYNYEMIPNINITDSIDTSIDLNFNFAR